MKLIDPVPRTKAPADRFTGDVYLNPLHTGEDPSRLVAALVHFTPGARTNWHSHPLGQTLHCTVGEGIVAAHDGNVHRLPRCPSLPLTAEPTQFNEGKTMQTVTLNNGVEMPILGFGVFQIPHEVTQTAVEAALAAGYRHLDTAASYGNEAGVGAAIKASGIAREELFVTTKLWIQHAPTGNVQDDSKRAFEDSLSRLGLDYVDLYLIHQPLGDYYSEWRAMQDINKEGRARAIGVSNFHQDRLVDLIDHNEIVPAVNQIETHPFHQRAADQALMIERGIQIESWGPFAEGRNNLFTDPVLSAIAESHGKSVAQVVLRWLIQRDVVVIPKSVRPDRMAQNLDVFDFTLTEEQMDAIAAMDTGASQFFDHRDPAMVSWLGGRRIS